MENVCVSLLACVLLVSQVHAWIANYAADSDNPYKPVRYRPKRALFPANTFGDPIPSSYNGAAVNSTACPPGGRCRPIIGGEDTLIQRHPYVVAVLISENGKLYQNCGGTLVAPTKVVTAAHCVVDDITYYVIMGKTDLAVENDPNQQFKVVSKVELYDGYDDNDAAKRKDLAILTVDTPFTFTPYVSTLELGGFLDGLPGALCSLSGWGDTEDEIPSILQSAEFPTISTVQCGWTWYFYYPKSLGWVDFSEICVQDPNIKTSPCFGDSGSPLVCNNRLVGVVSWGPAPCRPTVPGVFTRVNYFSPWIRQRI